MPADHTPNERTEKRLREMLADAAAPGRLDAGTIIRKSRRRRRVRALAATSVGALAVVGIAAALAGGIPAPAPLQTASESSDAGGDAGDDASAFSAETDSSAGGAALAPVEKLNPCGEPVSALAATARDLMLEARFPDPIPAGDSPVFGTVSLENSGEETVTGRVGSGPALTLSREGVTVWHTQAGSASGQAVQLDPGESMSFEVALVPVECGPEDEARETFRSELPPLEAGEYRLDAVLELTTKPGSVSTLLIAPSLTVRVE
ncbi:hypothetical protein OH146_12730 [Salinibacterium sp. SYSU T00001]|uniref:hypothetical protein n=1 Tax=Homoserinimonas sedimenticola TaxID=2986805 RepID=UPI002235F4DC|nr:hypothetical protein [Salinibacterium sedimenticola]MCW4386639.1 hypothetical protein [Salinibacterium sedimenticola]